MVVAVEQVYFIIFFFTLVATILSLIVYRAQPMEEDIPSEEIKI